MLISDWISDVCSSDLGIFILTSTWVQGRKLLFDRIHRDSPPLDEFVERTGPSLERVPGTAVFMTGNSEVVPHALLHNLKHNKVLHQRVVVKIGRASCRKGVSGRVDLGCRRIIK